jgi:hypothetical protein
MQLIESFNLIRIFTSENPREGGANDSIVDIPLGDRLTD